MPGAIKPIDPNASILDQFMTAASNTLAHLMEVPKQMLSVKGIADSAGFMVLGIVNNMITPALKTAVGSLPAAPYFRGVVDGAVMKANFVYGSQCA